MTIIYEGKTYKVESFDYGHEEDIEMVGMIDRKPLRLSYYQKKLKSVKLSKNLKTAELYLFRRSTKLNTLTYPKKVRTIQVVLDGKVYVKNNTVRNQVRVAGFKGQILIK